MSEKSNPVYELKAQEYNLKLAEALKKIPEIQEPDWVKFVKSSSSKARPIEDSDFWYKRTASILRKIYKEGVLGTNRLKNRYGSKKNRGMKPEVFRKASGKIIRSILKQLDSAGLTEIIKPIRGVKSKRPGRQLTNAGKSLLEGIN